MTYGRRLTDGYYYKDEEESDTGFIRFWLCFSVFHNTSSRIWSALWFVWWVLLYAMVFVLIGKIPMADFWDRLFPRTKISWKGLVFDYVIGDLASDIQLRNGIKMKNTHLIWLFQFTMGRFCLFSLIIPGVYLWHQV